MEEMAEPRRSSTSLNNSKKRSTFTPTQTLPRHKSQRRSGSGQDNLGLPDLFSVTDMQGHRSLPRGKIERQTTVSTDHSNLRRSQTYKSKSNGPNIVDMGKNRASRDKPRTKSGKLSTSRQPAKPRGNSKLILKKRSLSELSDITERDERSRPTSSCAQTRLPRAHDTPSSTGSAHEVARTESSRSSKQSISDPWIPDPEIKPRRRSFSEVLRNIKGVFRRGAV
ncbi:uncharacterized protein BCR38DRAFT_241600 [Pseudomassariella vexata]|uniref:Uncharacterized protein n=1 Tax=Pseudomassariella vexata TaxID=1141098 RepID=A0A1Y2DTN6_9PEZI|nr:uncharacterized protein BCR38DRAFT_241600 [Pseudomassariella vexata]ORY62514.1 hypothetical protein BCR38DRAFT_241600 [Pseudomassariella vexata]